MKNVQDVDIEQYNHDIETVIHYIQQLEHHIGEITEKVAQIKAEQQNLICDFKDYINDGVQNPAP